MSTEKLVDKLINLSIELVFASIIPAVIVGLSSSDEPDFEIRWMETTISPALFTMMTSALSSALVNLTIDFRPESFDIIAGSLLPKSFDTVQAYLEKPLLAGGLQMFLYTLLVTNSTFKQTIIGGISTAIGQSTGELVYYGYSKLASLQNEN